MESLGFLNAPGASRTRMLFQTINPETGNPPTPEAHGLDRGMERIRNGFALVFRRTKASKEVFPSAESATG
jgi:hypothetical protein